MSWHNHRQRAGRVGRTQTGAEVVRIGHPVEHQQQWRAFGAIEQLVEHRLTPHLTRADVGHHALMHALDPGIHLAALALADTDPRLRGQFDQYLHTRVAPAFGQPYLLDALGMMAQQRFHGVQAIDLSS